jgi:hypothetical protein
MFNLGEIEEWEQKVDVARIDKFWRQDKHYFDPRREALIRHRRRSKWRRFTESPYARKVVQKRFKMRMKGLLHNENYHNPVPHEYRTYGWETW